jgi:hypothetical protein
VADTSARIVDELPFGVGWIAPTPAVMRRCSHALVADDGGVWWIDPVDEPVGVERALALGPPAGVIQLLDRHNRDCAALAQRFAVPHHRLPATAPQASPFEVKKVVGMPGWREIALWWPERKVLVVADCIGAASYFRAPGDPVGPHPFLRMFPPKALGRLRPQHLLMGHGPGIHGDDAADVLEGVLRRSRRRVPAWLAGLARNQNR